MGDGCDSDGLGRRFVRCFSTQGIVGERPFVSETGAVIVAMGPGGMMGGMGQGDMDQGGIGQGGMGGHGHH